MIEELTNNTSTSNTTGSVSIDEILCPGGICPEDLCADNCNNHGLCTLSRSFLYTDEYTNPFVDCNLLFLVKECIGQTTEECYSPSK